MTEMLLYLYAESPVHAGGADSLGALDLPVQREATTRYPVIWGQSLKGALRQAAEDAAEVGADGWDTDTVIKVFGSEIRSAGPDGEAGGATTAGLLSVGDAQLVAMPVPTLQRTFAWVTSHLVLARLSRKYRHLGAAVPPVPEMPSVAEGGGSAASAEWINRPAGSAVAAEVLGPCLVELGEAADPLVTGWAERLSADLLGGEVPFGQMAGKLATDLLLVGSDIMPTLLTECTEFVARVQLSSGKTVENGPFYSEYLPAETILAGVLTFRGVEAARAHGPAVRKLLDGRLHQFGGDETLGKGLMWTRLLGGVSATAGREAAA